MSIDVIMCELGIRKDMLKRTCVFVEEQEIKEVVSKQLYERAIKYDTDKVGVKKEVDRVRKLVLFVDKNGEVLMIRAK